MKYQSTLFAVVAALSLGAQAAYAEGAEKKDKDKGEHKEGVIEKFDTNKDGALSKDELTAVPEKKRAHLLEKFDTNKDGELSKDELAAMKDEKKKEKEKAEEKK